MSAPCNLEFYPDDRPGIARQRRGRGFSYIAPDGTRIADLRERKRLSALAVPPAWEGVWISPKRNGHLQATGRDVKTRKQYRYHDDWSALRARKKFDHLLEFGEALPGLRRRVLRDLRNKEAGDHSFAIAAVIALIDRACLRIGSQTAVRENRVYGATTLRRRHIDLESNHIRLTYRAKGGQIVSKALQDKTLNTVFSSLDDLPGADLMTWVDDAGQPRTVTAGEVNAFLTDYLENDALTAKTFRTWNGTVSALQTVVSNENPTIKDVAEAAAERLHNTPSIARTSYIHPHVIDLVSNRNALPDFQNSDQIPGLRQTEARLIKLLRKET